MAKKKKCNAKTKTKTLTTVKPIVKKQTVSNDIIHDCKHRNEKGYCTWLDNKCNPWSMKCVHQKLSHMTTVTPSAPSAKKQSDRVSYRTSGRYNPFNVEYYGINTELGTINKFNEIPNLNVFKGYLNVDKKQVMDFKMIVQDIKTGSRIQILVAYHIRTEKYYISDKQLKYLHKNKYFPKAVFQPSNAGSIPLDTFDFNEYSILSLYGYCAGKNGLREFDRRQILIHLLDNRILRAYEIVSHLQGLISLREERTDRDFSQAIKDWNDDIIFVNNYQGTPKYNLIYEKKHYEIKFYEGRLDSITRNVMERKHMWFKPLTDNVMIPISIDKVDRVIYVSEFKGGMYRDKILRGEYCICNVI